ncbi:PREDICTED: DTW domain-containing protein 2 [Tarenaya hassleriana]|uniref:DTW domain-containing protein 2 n=1 Tax=Tarenaya hassleriana TaxID=28532 RepID=UPI00053C6821|nr:PREDICTED: DTW domain-containing protein 2 [Tarenaya hassleriana]
MEDTDDTTAPSLRQYNRRQICGGCDRPMPVCLCHVIPEDPIQTRTKIVILHHPHESKHKLNTVPLLTKSLRHVTTISGRRLLRHHISGNGENNPNSSAAIYLFPPSPSSPAVTLSEIKSRILLTNQTSPVTLIVFDGTWKHAKEMVKASAEVLREAGAVRVCLDAGFDESVSGGSIYDSELLPRKEPFGGGVSTAEAVARWLGTVEPEGEEIERKVIRVLREMVRLQSGFLKPMKPRPKLMKKNKQMNEEEEEEEEE